MIRTALAYVPYLLCVTALWLVSNDPRPEVPDLLTFQFSDKLLHAVAYSLVGACAALGATRRAGLTRAALVEAVVLGAGYGVVDEIHQAFVPGRSSTVSDAVADLVGVCFGAWLFRRFWRSRTAPVEDAP